MGLDFITHNGNKYPKWESEGNAARWILPLAKHILDPERNVGYDIGYSKEAWMLPGAIGIEPSIDPNWDAMRLPNNQVDYIFSSHCLEHVKANVYDVLDYWLSKIKVGGILFLYLPHSSQSYWHPSSNRKHVHTLDESEIETYLNDLGHKVYVSGCDWNHSFVVICEKVSDRIIAKNRAYDECVKKGVINEDIPKEHYPVKDKPSFTKVTPENQNQFGDIPIGHYVADNVFHEETAKAKKIAGYLNYDSFISMSEVDELSREEQLDLLFGKDRPK